MTGRGRSPARALGAAGAVLALTSEGLYNHVVKNALYWIGLPGPWTRLFPPPTYEMPNDLLFEVTGILQVLPAAMAAHGLRRNP